MPETIDQETGEIKTPIVSRYYRTSGADLAKLFAALAKAQGQFESAERAGTNEAFKRGGKSSTYATLDSVIEATKKGRADNELAILQLPGNAGNNISVTTILGHSSGQWIEGTFAVAPQQFTAQGAGSVITYLRRYAMMSILGIAPEDDDGNAASLSQPSTQVATRTTPIAKPATPSVEIARAIWSRISADIKNATNIEQLNLAGIWSAKRDVDMKAIIDQPGGQAVWDGLVERDARKRLELAGDEGDDQTAGMEGVL